MKARCFAAPVRVSQNHQGALEITLLKKMLKMKVAPQSLLKTKGQIKCSSEFIENKRVSVFSLLLYDTEGLS
jgi:hypothetical protein